MILYLTGLTLLAAMSGTAAYIIAVDMLPEQRILSLAWAGTRHALADLAVPLRRVRALYRSAETATAALFAGEGR